MKSFYKNIISSCLGSILAFIIVFAIIAIGITIYTTKNKPNQKGILHIPIKGTISDYNGSSFDLYHFDFSQSSTTLWDTRKKLNAASEDDNIEGVLLDFNTSNLSQEMTLEIAEIIKEFKKSGKPIYSYSYFYDQNAYLLSTFSDSIFLNPNGGVDLKGYAIYSPFFKGFLDHFGIDVNVYSAGKYKSSTEPYRIDEFSAENEYQYREFLGQLKERLISEIATNRGISKEKVQKIISDQKSHDGKYMVNFKIVDRLVYDDQLKAILKRDFDHSELVPFHQYEVKKGKSKNAETAIVFAEGEINWGSTAAGSITYEEMSSIFETIKKDDNIKNVILRINSPGGNGYTSDLIYREIELLKSEGKKVYASLGPYAASGGYYIASACDSIFASASTLTGSIGVYIILPTFDKFMAEKLYITTDSIKTDPEAISYSPILGITKQQEITLIAQTEELYEQFLGRVAEGRKMKKGEVHEIAQGRIWSGKDAKDLGLVDEIMSLETLITSINKGNKALAVYPKQNLSLQQQILKNGLEKFAKAEIHEIKLINSKLVEFQKIIEKPSPVMKIYPFTFVTNR